MALNSAYLEDEMAKLIVLVQSLARLHDKIQAFRVADQARHLRKALAKEFAGAPNYSDRQWDSFRTDRVLRSIEVIAQERNDLLHSPLVGGQAIPILRSRRRPRRVPSRDIYELAERLAQAHGSVMDLQSYVGRLRRNVGR